MLRLDWVLVQLFVFQWPRARNHVKGIEFNWRSVPFDRGFGHLRGGIGLSVLNWVENQLGIRKGASKSFILCNTLSVHQRRQTDIAKDCFLFCRQKKEVCSQNNTQTRHAKSRNNICKMQTYIFLSFEKSSKKHFQGQLVFPAGSAASENSCCTIGLPIGKALYANTPAPPAAK